ncbi:MAG: 3'-5' exonuclease [Actinomycetota bacterium]|nr:3'-5' exonuclease [Actinomycetota bacterium]
MTDTVFACFDVETTRLDPASGHVIEIAVVRIATNGRSEGEWSTLVNPGTEDLGRVDIHGIQLSWLAGAPTFGEIAGDLATFMSGCVPVAHNASFDCGFLRAEWERAGLGRIDLEALDTLPLAKNLGLPGRLADLTTALGIPLNGAHMALGDSRALAGVLIALLARADNPVHTPPFDPPLLTPAASGRFAHRSIPAP